MNLPEKKDMKTARAFLRCQNWRRRQVSSRAKDIKNITVVFKIMAVMLQLSWSASLILCKISLKTSTINLEEENAYNL